MVKVSGVKISKGKKRKLVGTHLYSYQPMGAVWLGPANERGVSVHHWREL